MKKGRSNLQLALAIAHGRMEEFPHHDLFRLDGVPCGPGAAAAGDPRDQRLGPLEPEARRDLRAVWPGACPIGLLAQAPFLNESDGGPGCLLDIDCERK